MRLVLIALLVLTMAGAAGAADLSRDQAGTGQQVSHSRSLVYCVGSNYDNAFYENGIYAYGNALTMDGSGPLTTLDFYHDGYGFVGPYDYTLFVYDAATCTVIGSVPGLVAGDAAAGLIEEVVDLCPYDLAVTGDIVVAIQPQSCIVPTDCYPDIGFDVTTPPAGCGMRATVGVDGSCVQILSTSGVVDFLLGVTFNECAAPPVTGACCVPGATCVVLSAADCALAGGTYVHDGPCTPADCESIPTEATSWGAVKALYR